MATLKKLTAAALRLPQETVDVPELGEDAQILIRQMSVGEMLDFEARCFDDKGQTALPFDEFMITLLIQVMVDEEGQPIASRDEKDALLTALPGAVAMRLFKVASRINGLAAGSDDSVKKP